MSLIRWDPFRELLSMEDDFRRMMQRTFGGERSPVRAGETEAIWLPDIEMHEKEDAVLIKADLPGITGRDIDIDVDKTSITIRGERKFEEEIKEKDYYRSERHYGSFERMIPLPSEIKPAEAKATFKDGVLNVELPKAAVTKPERVKVKVK